MLPLILSLLACTSESGDSGLEYATTQPTDGGTWSVAYTTEPSAIPLGEDFVLQLVITPPTELTVLADALMPEDDLRMDVDPSMTQEAAGLWTAAPMNLSVEGDWQIIVGVGGGAYSERAFFNVECCE